MHQIEAHQAGKGERAESAFLRGLGEAQQEEGDEGDGDLNAHGIFAGADELSDLQRLLDPAEEELDGPAPLVEVGDLLRACREIVAEDAQNLASFDPDADLAHRHAKWVLAIVRLPLGQLSDRVGQLPKRQANNRKNPFGVAVREIRVRIETGKVLRILSNDLSASAQEIADLYKRRWAIELFFRWVKQTLKIRKFVGTSENAVRIQITVALIAFLLLRLAQATQKSALSPLSFARLVRLNLMHL